MSTPIERAIVIVLDGVGIGALPDAAAYGDQGSHTLGHVCRLVRPRLPGLEALGLGRIAPLDGIEAVEAPAAAFGRMAERSPGKDSVTGHWELMGLVLERPFPTFPHGFPAELVAEFEAAIGRRILGNVVASGTQIIEELGVEHLRTGSPIVYTSADSVFQVAAHEDVIPVPELYGMCQAAYRLTVEERGVGRVIARPFVGEPGRFTRTTNRHDFAMPAPDETLLDRLTAAGVPVLSVGKIEDLFAGRGVSRSVATGGDEAVMNGIEEAMATEPCGLVFANLVDFDSLYGHRNDVKGYGANLERFDRRLARLLPTLHRTDLLVLTADHGNDPSTPSTDHSREYVPLLVTGACVRPGVDLGTRESFADLGQTLADIFGVGPLRHGTSFLGALATANGRAPAARDGEG